MKHLKKTVVALLTVLLVLSNTATAFADDEQAAAEPGSSYSVHYEFVLNEGDEALPDEVNAKLPEDITNLQTGDEVENFAIEDVVLDDVTYSFLGWSKDKVTIADSDVTVTGTWEKKVTEQEPAAEPEEPVKIEETETSNKVYYTVKYMFADATARDGIGNLPDEIMKLLPEEEKAEVGTDYNPKEPAEKSVAGYEFHGYEPYQYENGDVVYQGIWFRETKNLLKAGGPLRAGAYTFGYGGQQNWGLAANNGYTGHNGFSISGMESWCIDPHTPLSEIGTAYDALGSDGGRAAEIIAMGKMNGRSQAEIQAAVWNSMGVSATVNGAYIDPNDSDFNSNGRYGYSVDLFGGDGLQTQAASPSWWPLGGYVKVYKRAAEVNGINYASSFPNNYSLASAVYGVYSNAACTSLEDTVTTGASGESGTTDALDPGTYYVKEISASPGFKLDPNIYPVTVTAGNTSSITSTEAPVTDPMMVHLYKQDRRESKWVNHLDEAQFTLKYYDAQTNDPRSSSPKLTFVFKTQYNAEGKVECDFGNPDLWVSGDSITPYLINGVITYPLGTFTIEESTAPQLFAIDPNTYVGHITQNGELANEAVDHYIDENGSVKELTNGSAWILEVDNVDLTQNEELQTVVLNIQKIDMESGKAELPTDHITNTATLAGGVFHIYRIGEYNTDKENPQIVDIAPVDYGTIVTDENGVAELKFERVNGVDTEDGLLPGKFRIIEEKAPNGFALKPTLAENTYVLEAPVKEKNTATFKYTMDVANKLTRIQIEKLDQNGDLVSGEATATIQLIETATGKVVYEFVADGQAHLIRGLTSLMNYHLHELYVAPNYKLAIDKNVNAIDENDSELHSSIDADHPYTNYYHMVDHEVEIHTIATFDNEGKKEWDNQSNKHYVADGVAHIFDEVSYKNVYEGETYKLVGELWDKTDDVSLGNVVEKEFTPKYDVGIETLEFHQQLDDLDNHELVVFETLYRIVTNEDGSTEEIEVVEHKDLDDEGQTIYVDELYRRDFEIVKVNADDTTEPLEGVVFNVKTYRVKRDGVVEDNDLGEFTTDADGMIYIEKLKEDCKITVTEVEEKDPTWYRWEEPFIYDIGHDASVTEALSVTIENHQIKIHTTAKFEESDDKNYVADGVAHIIDTVDYEWLYEGDQYRLVATLIDKGTEDNPTEEEVTTVEHEFTASGLNGSEDVSIEFDFTDMDNHDFVVFEELYHIVTEDVPQTDEEGNPVVDEEGNPVIDKVPTGEEPQVAEHKDIDDEDQTVHVDELYRAVMVMYKTNASKTIRLNGAVFTVTTKRTKRDGSVVTANLGKYVTGGIFVENNKAFTYKIATDEEMSDVVKTLTSSKHSKFGTQYVQATDLADGIYYGQIEGEEKVTKHYVAKGMIYLVDQAEDTEITYHEEIAPEGYYLPGYDFVANVGHDYSLTKIENERPNQAIVRREEHPHPVIPNTGVNGE